MNLFSDKTRDNGTKSEKQFRAWLISQLRKITRIWGPKNLCLQQAKDKAKERIEAAPEKYEEYLTKKGKAKRGYFVCATCDEIQHIKTKDGKSNIAADHIEPIIDPTTGFRDWNTWFDRAFVEVEGYQALCHSCHNIKSQSEGEVRRTKK